MQNEEATLPKFRKYVLAYFPQVATQIIVSVCSMRNVNLDSGCITIFNEGEAFSNHYYSRDSSLS
ncbi:hypothetical protein [Vibrio caribbeanicus]|uniref:hypothetical protein n=1 Tax=Vibrio caribbeanicus TaxID=701175 RepID=UPI00228525F7|nr:hypothetical protein [Vibrio caribbeanicus]MCY9843224.1 hypothetical protein [Vibrio caribbeanicus]